MSTRRALLVHNYYRHRGGEDAAVDAQRALLQSAGWEVGLFSVRSQQVAEAPLPERLSRYAQMPWSFGEAARFRRELAAGDWPLVHFHNLSPFLGAAVASALPAGVAGVMTVHNFRSVCINGLLLRDGKVCEACPQGSALNGVLHRCHEGSLPQSLALTLAQASSRAAGLRHSLGRYLFPSRFHLQKHLGYGFPQERSIQLPNFVADPGASGPGQGGGLYLGRLSREKGVETLVRALRSAPLPFVIAGAGPLEAWVREACQGLPQVQVLGWQDAEGVAALMRSAAYLALPSICYENQPLAALQALGHGLPLLVSDLGGLPELGVPGLNGAVVPAADAAAWAQALRAMQDAGSEQRRAWGEASRAAYLQRHTAAAHLAGLESAYGEAA